MFLPIELMRCAGEFYNKCIGLFNSALSDLDKDPLNSRTDVQDAGTEVYNCMKALKNTNETFDSRVSYRNNKIFLLSAVSFFSINHLT